MSNHVRMYINPMFFAHGKKDWRWSLCCRDMYYWVGPESSKGLCYRRLFPINSTFFWSKFSIFHFFFLFPKICEIPRTWCFCLFWRVSPIVTERLRILINISNYFRILKTMEKTLFLLASFFLQNFHFFRSIFQSSIFSSCFFPNMWNLTSLIFMLLEKFMTRDRTPPHIDTYMLSPINS